MAEAQKLRPLGSRGPMCTAQGLGAASFGDRFELLPNADALAAIDTAWGQQLRYFDTAPWYGKGLSEHRLGLGLYGKPRGEYILQTKVGRYLRPAQSDAEAADPSPWNTVGAMPFQIEFDYSFNAVMEQHQHSLQRLGTHRVDSLVIHDIEGSGGAGPGFVGRRLTVDQHLDVLFDEEQGGFRALQQLRKQGSIAAFGAGVNGGGDAEKRAWNKAYCHRLANMDPEDSIDFFLLAEGFTLMNHFFFEDGILDLCRERGIGVVVGGPQNSGLLAKADPTVPYTHEYPADPIALKRAEQLHGICAKHGVSLMAAALQFPLGHPATTSVIPGGKNAQEVAECVEAMNASIPMALWMELRVEGLIPPGMPVPGEDLLNARL